MNCSRLLLIVFFVVPYFSCSTSFQKLKYPEEFPQEIVSSTQNIEGIVVKFNKTKKDSLELLSKRLNINKRSKASVMKGVMQNLAKLRYGYNRRLVQRPSLFGKITVDFSILQNGKVNSAVVIYSTISDPVLESAIADSIHNWQFESMSIGIDTTFVTYPFVFTQGQSAQDVWNLDIEKNKSGDRPTEEIAEAVEELKSKLFPIYWNMNRNVRKGDALTVKMSIRRDGFINSMDLISSSFDSAQVEIEMLKKIREWVFPECSECKDNYTVVEYTLRFPE